MTDENCLFCVTSIKLKGLLMSGLLVCCAVATSVLTFTTNCERVVTFANNQTQTINDIGMANKFVSISLLSFSVASAIFERYINKKLLAVTEENEDLKTELAVSRNHEHEPVTILETPSPNTPNVKTNVSDDTVYPTALNFGRR